MLCLLLYDKSIVEGKYIHISRTQRKETTAYRAWSEFALNNSQFCFDGQHNFIKYSEDDYFDFNEDVTCAMNTCRLW